MSQHKTVKLVSAEGFEFLCEWDAACVSNTIKNMLSSQGEDAPEETMSGWLPAEATERAPAHV